jgi:hypothetical protein
VELAERIAGDPHSVTASGTSSRPSFRPRGMQYKDAPTFWRQGAAKGIYARA